MCIQMIAPLDYSVAYNVLAASSYISHLNTLQVIRKYTVYMHIPVVYILYNLYSCSSGPPCSLLMFLMIILFKKYRVFSQRLIMYLSISAFFQPIPYIFVSFHLITAFTYILMSHVFHVL